MLMKIMIINTLNFVVIKKFTFDDGHDEFMQV